MNFTYTKTIRPIRFLYTAGLTVLVFFNFGWAPASLMLLSHIDVVIKERS